MEDTLCELDANAYYIPASQRISCYLPPSETQQLADQVKPIKIEQATRNVVVQDIFQGISPVPVGRGFRKLPCDLWFASRTFSQRRETSNFATRGREMARKRKVAESAADQDQQGNQRVYNRPVYRTKRNGDSGNKRA